ncbi:MAG: Bug family tripartite tricarboxylate transporter substrate binding protein [Alphaproteobacteria bacterium]
MNTARAIFPHRFLLGQLWCCLLLICAMAGLNRAVAAEPAQSFYSGKNITLVIGTGPGGAYDIHGRLLSRHFGKHLAGAPKLIVQNMPGAGSITASNYVYAVAAQDGTVLANILNTVPLAVALGQVQTQFDPSKFQWIGNMVREVYVVMVWHTAPAKSIEDAKSANVLLGATSPAALSGIYPPVFNDLLGTKFQRIAGYKEAVAIDLAVERGEVHGRAGETWYGRTGTMWEWVRDGKGKIILQIGFNKADELQDVPLFLDLVKNDPEKRQLAELFSSPALFGKPTVVSPNVPADRVSLLRRAYADTMKDPEFLADAKKLGINIEPVSGDELSKLAKSFGEISPTLLDQAKRMAN